MRLTQQTGKKRYVTFEGGAGAPGVAVGEVVVIYPLADLDAVPRQECRKYRRRAGLC